MNKPYNIFRKPDEINDSVKFIFSDLYYNQTMFQTILESNDDFASINFSTLKDHYNYGYKFQIKVEGVWKDIDKYRKILPTQHVLETNLSYSFIKEKSSHNLLVIFSSSPNSDVFNYSKIVNDIKVNKLFISDKNLEGHQFSALYFLGYMNNLFLENEVIELINKCIEELKISRDNVILAGSSKGGFASLYYAFKYKFSKVIVGSPTVYLGSMHKNSSFGIKTISNLTGVFNEESVEWLDNLITSNVHSSTHKPHIFYHVGDKENRYKNHALPFLSMLSHLKKGTYELDLGDYKDHAEVSKYFPLYFKKVLNYLTNV